MDRGASLLLRIARHRGTSAVAGVGDDSYVVCQTLALRSTEAQATDADAAAVVSKLAVLAAKYAQFHRSVEPCLYSSCGAGPSARSPSEGVAPRGGGGGEKSNPLMSGKTHGTGAVASAALVPDLEACWSATSPMPPTAVLAAMYGMAPLQNVSAGSPTSLELQWELCRCSVPAEAAARALTPRVCFRDAFAMTVAAAAEAHGSASGSVVSSSSLSSCSLAEQLRRASAALESGGAATTAASAGAAFSLAPRETSTSSLLLDWPEEFFWNVLTSLLASLALVHSAGLHFNGLLTAADVLCVACAPTLPRRLEQTWADVAAASAGAEAALPGDVAAKGQTVFRRFYATAVPSVILPQVAVSATTPCHHAFFVVVPSTDLLHWHGAGSTDVAPLSEQATPAEQARQQAADLASVGRLLGLMLELRAQGHQRRSTRGGITEQSLSNSTAPAPSSELTFLVRRLTECGSAQASGPTAVQLLQLQALRLRTECWYYRRVAEEACDRTGHATRSVPSPRATTKSAPEGLGEAQKREAAMTAREAQLADREAKLNVMLQLYELTHEHLDALSLPPPQSTRTPTQAPLDRSAYAALPSDETLERLLTASLLQPPPPPQRQTGFASPAHTAAAFYVNAGDGSGEGLFGISPLGHLDAVGDTMLSATSAVTTAATALATTPTPVTPIPAAQRRQHASGGTPDGAACAALQPVASVVEVELDVTDNEGRSTSATGLVASGSTTPVQTPTAALESFRVPPPSALPNKEETTPSPLQQQQQQQQQQVPLPRQRQLFSSPGLDSALPQQTPVRAPALPNMGGTADSSGGGPNTASGAAAPHTAHSRYSALSLLRTPPSARRSATGSRLAATSPAVATHRAHPDGKATASAVAGPAQAGSASPHSPEAPRSTTRPYTAATAPAGALLMNVEVHSPASPADLQQHQHHGHEQPPPRLLRRRSSSRGSAGAAADGRSPLSDSGGPGDGSAAWARQQLTALAEMQTALRAQQPATPRSRLSGSVTSAVPTRAVAAPSAMALTPSAPVSAEATPGRSDAAYGTHGVGDDGGGDDDEYRMTSARTRSSGSDRLSSRYQHSGSQAWAGHTYAGTVGVPAAVVEPPRVQLAPTSPFSTPPTTTSLRAAQETAALLYSPPVSSAVPRPASSTAPSVVVGRQGYAYGGSYGVVTSPEGGARAAGAVHASAQFSTPRSSRGAPPATPAASATSARGAALTRSPVTNGRSTRATTTATTAAAVMVSSTARAAPASSSARPQQRPAAATSASFSAASAGSTRLSSTTAVELLRRLRANAAA